jgi:hypothetical protein
MRVPSMLRSHVLRLENTHRILWYLEERTNPKFAEWHFVTQHFFFELYDLKANNPAITMVIYAVDGMRIYVKDKLLVYLHFRNKHFLIHARKNDLLYMQGDTLFGKHARTRGSWPRMWKATEASQVTNLMNFLRRQPKITRAVLARSRTIPRWVKVVVFERDEGKCVVCGTKVNLHFDHIYPFSWGGSSKLYPDSAEIRKNPLPTALKAILLHP